MAQKPTYEELEQRVKELQNDAIERKRMEEALRESEQRFQQVVENDQEWVWEVDANGLYTYASPVVEKILGYKPEEIVGKKHFYDLFHPEDREAVKTVAFEAFARKQHFKEFINRNTNKNGTEVWLSTSGVPILDDNGNLLGYQGADTDITERKQAEEQIKQEAASPNLVLESLPYPFYVIDANDYLVKMANSAARLGDLSKDITCYALTHRSDRPCEPEGHPCPLEKIKETKKPVTVEHRHYDKDGNLRNVEVQGFPIFDSEGNVVQMIEYCLDITYRKQAEQQIRTLSQQLIKMQESERQRISSDLHDYIAQDLSSLKIGLDTLLDNHSEALPETRQRVSKLSKMIQGTIMAVRNLAYDLRPAGLNQLGLARTVQQHCEEFSSKSGVKVDFFTSGIDDSKIGYDTKITLYRMIQESLNNVKKHADASRVTIRLVASFPNIILRIEDNGKGFDVENRMVSAANERRMGLRTMEERVAMLQGKMRLESHPMRGTKIFIEVPCEGKDNGK